jgi:hypothetical protein
VIDLAELRTALAKMQSRQQLYELIKNEIRHGAAGSTSPVAILRRDRPLLLV